MKNIIDFINLSEDFITLGSCCGHGKYPMSIVVRDISNNNRKVFEVFSDVIIPRHKRFYRTDKNSVYYIPEVLNNDKEIN